MRLHSLKVIEPTGYGSGSVSEMKVQVGNVILHTRLIHPPGYEERAPRAYFEHQIKQQMTDMIAHEIMRKIEES
ncbi:hypothetical protein [Burkholderia ubonensis]|uniref:hypothetical protein n=1 Tax=Burkholderia ubonensis TaxID=101571 RepID=UPI000752FDD6|nr:hypothetical protein [Burkholderia ubonensis]KWI10916.1 hypothetical protein WM01_19375 [Burkholderia ubonensis]OJA94448.1 hypothetical protein BGV51_28215 [Burkholderia ubonensis]